MKYKMITVSLVLALLVSPSLHNTAQIPFMLDEKSEVHDFAKAIFDAPFHTTVDLRSYQFTAHDSMLFDSILRMVERDSNMLCLAGGIRDDKERTWSGVANGASVTPSSQATTQHYFGIGSVTKSITAAAIMLLAEDSVLSLEDSLYEWLPSYPNIDSTITIRQLLNMTSGIYNFTEHPNYVSTVLSDLSRIWQPEEILQAFVDTPYFEKGKGWHYSNTNYLLLGLIIEEASGMPYHVFVRKRIFEPAGLDAMAIFPYDTPPGPIATIWLDVNNDNIPDDLSLFNYSPNAMFSMAWAAGACMATPQLLTDWMFKLVTGQVVTPSSLNEMISNGIPIGKGVRYGLGLVIVTNRNGTYIGHGGSILYRTYIYHYVPANVTVSTLTSNAHKGDVLPPTYGKLLVQYLQLPPVTSVYYPSASPTLTYDGVKWTVPALPNATHLQLFHLPTGRYHGMYHFSNTTILRINTQHLPSGMYLLRYTNAQGQVVEQMRCIKY